jgi:hypothetical protein
MLYGDELLTVMTMAMVIKHDDFDDNADHHDPYAQAATTPSR